MNPAPLHLEDIEKVSASTGMSEARIRELRSMPEPQGDQPLDLIIEWGAANALAAEVNHRLALELLERLGPRTGRRRPDTGTGPIEGIPGGPSLETLRTATGPCQRCDAIGALELVGDRWLCDRHARRQERRDRFREAVKAA